MEIEIISTKRARLVRDDEGTVWCNSRTSFSKRFRVMPERPMSMQLAAVMLGASIEQLCELLDNDVRVVRVSEIRLQVPGVVSPRKAGAL